MVCEACAFDTNRLLISPWHDRSTDELARIVTTTITARTSRALPPPWQGDYSEQRARRWIDERDAEGPTLVIVDKATMQDLGLVILFEESSDGETVVRLGYVLAERFWGEGFATELVEGFAAWCRGQPLGRILAGVGDDNPASARVLEKSGFSLLSERDGESLYHLELG